MYETDHVRVGGASRGARGPRGSLHALVLRSHARSHALTHASKHASTYARARTQAITYAHASVFAPRRAPFIIVDATVAHIVRTGREREREKEIALGVHPVRRPPELRVCRGEVRADHTRPLVRRIRIHLPVRCALLPCPLAPRSDSRERNPDAIRTPQEQPPRARHHEIRSSFVTDWERHGDDEVLVNTVNRLQSVYSFPLTLSLPFSLTKRPRQRY